MPAKSVKQRRLIAAAEHGADFPMAKKIRKSMSSAQMHDFSATPEVGLPDRVPKRNSMKRRG